NLFDKCSFRPPINTQPMDTLGLWVLPSHECVGVTKYRFSSQGVDLAWSSLGNSDSAFQVLVVVLPIAAFVGDEYEHHSAARLLAVLTMEVDGLADRRTHGLFARR